MKIAAISNYKFNNYQQSTKQTHENSSVNFGRYKIQPKEISTVSTLKDKEYYEKQAKDFVDRIYEKYPEEKADSILNKKLSKICEDLNILSEKKRASTSTGEEISKLLVGTIKDDSNVKNAYSDPFGQSIKNMYKDWCKQTGQLKSAINAYNDKVIEYAFLASAIQEKKAAKSTDKSLYNLKKTAEDTFNAIKNSETISHINNKIPVLYLLSRRHRAFIKNQSAVVTKIEQQLLKWQNKVGKNFINEMRDTHGLKLHV